MRCPEFLLRYDELEPGASKDWRLRRHISSCASCREEVRRVEAALSAWLGQERARETAGRAPDLVENRIMAAVRLTSRPRRELSLGQWAFPAFLLVLSCVLVPVASLYSGPELGIGNDLLFPLALVIGFCLVVFGSLFIGSHFDALSAYVDERTPFGTRGAHR